MEQDNKITLIDEKGNETLCDILFTFHSDNFNKDYVVFAVPCEEDEEQQEIGAASYVEKEGNVGDLQDIETEEEWAEVEEMLNSFLEDSECGCGCEDCDCDECHCDDCDCEECGHEHHHDHCDCGCKHNK